MREGGLEMNEDDEGFHRLMKNECRIIHTHLILGTNALLSSSQRWISHSFSKTFALPSTLSALKPWNKVFLHTLPRILPASATSASNSAKRWCEQLSWCCGGPASAPPVGSDQGAKEKCKLGKRREAVGYLQSSKLILKMFGFEFWAPIQDGSALVWMGGPLCVC